MIVQAEPTIESEIDNRIREIQDWLYLSGSDLLGITLSDEQTSTAETVMRTLNMVKKINADLNDMD